jgi:hypothetical protein
VIFAIFGREQKLYKNAHDNFYIPMVCGEEHRKNANSVV